VGAAAMDIAVGKITFIVLAVELLDGILFNVSGLVNSLEQVLNNLGLNRAAGTAEVVEVNLKPFVDIHMDIMITVAEFPGGDTFFQGLGFGGGAVFIGTTDVHGFITVLPAEPGKNVGGKHLYEISQVGDVVDIGESGGDKAFLHDEQHLTLGGGTGQRG
jgi:hypothetical protein